MACLITHQNRQPGQRIRASQTRVSGLCTACVRAGTCTFVRAASHTLLQCEEFAGALPREASSALPGYVQPCLEGQLAGGPDGLCSNCEGASTCHFPRPAGGVWHCEEYR